MILAKEFYFQGGMQLMDDTLERRDFAAPIGETQVILFSNQFSAPNLFSSVKVLYSNTFAEKSGQTFGGDSII